MANDRNYGFSSNQDRGSQDRDRDYGSGRDYSGSGAHDDRNFRDGGTGYGDRDQPRPVDRGGREAWGTGNRDYYGGSGDAGRGGQRFTGSADRDDNRGRDDHRGGGRAPQGYDYQDRGFVARAGDEVRSWFGDEDAERRRDFDQRFDERSGGNTAYGRDDHYHSWRRGQIDALDRDYHEYRQENAKKFENEFGTWRSARQTQRTSLGQVKEHMEVVGSDGGHVGTVDKVRGDRIILTKTDSEASGRHHSIPSGWLQTVDDKVTISKSADDAHKHWRDEEASGALFGGEGAATTRDKDGRVDLNRSFSGRY